MMIQHGAAEFSVKLAETEAELRLAQRLRYDVFVKELGGSGEMDSVETAQENGWRRLVTQARDLPGFVCHVVSEGQQLDPPQLDIGLETGEQLFAGPSSGFLPRGFLREGIVEFHTDQIG